MLKARTMIRFHRTLFVVWVLLLPLSYVLLESVPWVVFMSHYAIIVSHWAGWDASRAEQKAES
jgi:hypothetical protein